MMTPRLLTYLLLMLFPIVAWAQGCPDWQADKARDEITALQRQIDLRDDSYHRLG